jgi:hypothetical protein
MKLISTLLKSIASWLALLLLAVLLTHAFNAQGEASISHGVNLAAAQAAAERMGDWSEWMAGLSTAGLTALAVLLNKGTRQADGWTRALALSAGGNLTLSLMVATWVQSSIPSVLTRMGAFPQTSTAGRDIYQLPVADWCFAKHISMGEISRGQHAFFFCGCVMLAALMMLELRHITQKVQETPPG